MDALLQRAATLLRNSSRTVVLTGAGISTPSGIPDFRSPTSGLWATFDPLDVASVWSFHEAPERFYAWMRPLVRQILDARPNSAHLALARLEAGNLIHGIITQNIDGLHQRAGQRPANVIELHGTSAFAVCLTCGERLPIDEALARLADDPAPNCEKCGGYLKPATISFGQAMPEDEMQRAAEACADCEIFIAAGSSLVVHPAASLPSLARRNGARLIIINRTPTPLDEIADLVISDEIGQALPRLVGLKPQPVGG